MKKSMQLSVLVTLLLAVAYARPALAATASEAQASSLHVVPTNWPGVYAFTQPPADFDPLTASPGELESWGYPRRPSPEEGPDALARWSTAVSPALTRKIPELAKLEGVSHRPATRLTVRSQSTKAVAADASNWSGFALVPAKSAPAFDSVSGRWVLPTVKQPADQCLGGWDYSSQWVGMGGISDADLLQSGSEADVFCDLPGNNVAEYFPWIEWLPGPTLVLYENVATNTLFPFVPGDYLIVTVTATKFSGGASKNAVVNFADVTQGWSVAITFTAAAVGGSKVTGSSAQWILERPEVGSTLATLPDYFVDAWQYSAAEDMSSAVYYPGAPGTATVYDITMLDDSDKPISYANLYGRAVLWFFAEGSATK